MRKNTGPLLLLALSLAAPACAPTMIAAGAEIAASGLRDGTAAVASGGSPDGGAVTAVTAGVALMAAGTALTPAPQRQPPPPPPHAAQPIYPWPLLPANAPNAPRPHMGLPRAF